jgi:adenosine deaminase
MRSLPVEVAIHRVELAAEARDRGIGIVAIDLHGDELNFPGAPFAPAFRLARELGFRLRAHAGEATGPQSIWEAIEMLGVERIAHGVRAVEHPRLLRRLQEGDIMLELCPTSNVRTGLYPDLASHPIRRLYELGIPLTVASDDPLPFFTNVERECRLLVDELGFAGEDLRRLTLTAAERAFLPGAERLALVSQIDAAYSLQKQDAG